MSIRRNKEGNTSLQRIVLLPMARGFGAMRSLLRLGRGEKAQRTTSIPDPIMMMNIPDESDDWNLFSNARVGHRAEKKEASVNVETFLSWRPLSDVPKRLWIDGVHHDAEGLRVILRTAVLDYPRIRSLFRAPLAYRWFDEQWSPTPRDYARWGMEPDSEALVFDSIEPSPATGFYIVENSVWLLAFYKGEETACRKSHFKHYSIYAENFRVDAISAHEPIVEWLYAYSTASFCGIETQVGRDSTPGSR
jgi:hypothetical protein